MPAAADIQGVTCDLLTALVDSWTLWERVAGDPERGRQWRQVSLHMVTSAGAYRPYEEIVSAATAEMGLPPAKTKELLQRWSELEAYPDVQPALEAIRRAGSRLAVVTNCSQRLGELGRDRERRTGGVLQASPGAVSGRLRSVELVSQARALRRRLRPRRARCHGHRA